MQYKLCLCSLWLSWASGCVWVSKEDLAKLADRDGDGHDATQYGGGDCDDEDEAVSPDAAELCNEVDDDCDGAIDDVALGDGTTWYVDGDGDGSGDPDTVFAACTAQDGAVADGGDCDDTDAEVHPGGDEWCNGVDDDCDGALDDADTDFSGQSWWPDADADGYGAGEDTLQTTDCAAPEGYAAEGGDCDDGDAAVNPGAAEVCGGADDDCDGWTDDADDSLTEAPVWYIDADDDGYGDDAVSTVACEAPTGFVDEAGDCDDDDEGVHPGVDERCDDRDEDCDGVADDSAVDMSVWYGDGDGDGYGDDADRVTACDAPAGTSAAGGDCDDTDASVHPYAEELCTSADANCDGVAGSLDADGDGYAGCDADCDDADASISPAADEVCNGVDDDCDAAIDDADDDRVTTGLDRYYPDDDGDGYGDAEDAGEVACEAAAGQVSDDTDCDDADGEINPDAYEVCSASSDEDCDGDADDCVMDVGDASWAFEGGASADAAGAALLSGLDLDGDGADDLVIGATGLAATRGGVIVLSDVPDADADLGAATTWNGSSAGHGAGLSLASAGDVDGDGLDDVLVGSTAGEEAYLLAGPASSGGGLSGADMVIAGLASAAAFGAAVTMGDLDGDGQLDAVIGAPEEDVELGLGFETSEVGAVYAFFGGLGAYLDTDDADLRFQTSGQELNSYVGRALAMLDADGDGDQELLIAALDRDALGNPVPEIYLLDPVGGGELDDDDASRTFTGGTDQSIGGVLVAGGDVDGDGAQDLLLGDEERGKALLLLSPLSAAPTSLSSADATLTGDDDFGAAAAFVPDLDRDGVDELLIGGGNQAALWMGGGLSGALSADDADLTLDGDGSVDEAGAAVAAGDADGDGAAELFVGAPGAHSAAGAVYGLLGAGF